MWQSWDSNPGVLNTKAEFHLTFSGCAWPLCTRKKVKQNDIRLFWSLAQASAWGLPKKGVIHSFIHFFILKTFVGHLVYGRPNFRYWGIEVKIDKVPVLGDKDNQ